MRNCKLVLLLRKKYQEGEENTFRPAEWRWKLPQVCDDEWHHYAVNVNFPVVNLVIDGEEWTDQKDNPEIIDDWPLHNAGDISSKISIGACWQGIGNIFQLFKQQVPKGDRVLEIVVLIQQFTNCKTNLPYFRLYFLTSLWKT